MLVYVISLVFDARLSQRCPKKRRSSSLPSLMFGTDGSWCNIGYKPGDPQASLSGILGKRLYAPEA